MAKYAAFNPFVRLFRIGAYMKHRQLEFGEYDVLILHLMLCETCVCFRVVMLFSIHKWRQR